MAFIATVTYIAYYCIRVELNVYFGDGTRSNPVNPMLASISAAVQRVYGSAENPYSLILSFIMLTWALHKMSILGRYWPCGAICQDTSCCQIDSNQKPSRRTLFAKDYFSSMSSSSSHSNSREQQPWYMQIRWWRGVDILADCILLSIMLYAGVMGQVRAVCNACHPQRMMHERQSSHKECSCVVGRWKWNPASRQSRCCKGSLLPWL